MNTIHRLKILGCLACALSLSEAHGISIGFAQQTPSQPNGPGEDNAAPKVVLAVEFVKESEAQVNDAAAQPATEFLRMRTEGRDPVALDTAVVTYRSDAASGIQVDLIGAVHIGEKSYYQQLNRLFDQYDVLLYELVAEEGTVIPLGGRGESTGFNPVAMLQDSAKDMLGLESQLEQVDYTKSHFVRADMTPEQIGQKMAERGDTAFTLALSTLADVIRQQNKVAQSQAQALADAGLDELSLFELMGEPLKMKRVMAVQFASTGSLDQAMGGALNQLLVVDRNAEALKVLQKQIAAGKKKIGIFYGAAHLADFEKRLVEDFGLNKSQHRWLAAWDLKQSSSAAANQPQSLLFQMLKGLK